MENFSENKRKRGRPRSEARYFTELLPEYLRPEGGYRTQMNYRYSMVFLSAVRGAGEESHRAIWGATYEQILAGTRKLPKGWLAVGNSVGRWIALGGRPENAIEVVAAARRDGISSMAIARHFVQERKKFYEK